MDDLGIATEVRKFDTYYCPHCSSWVSKSSYYRHFREFFDKSSRCWKKQREEGFEEFDFDQEDVGENLWTALGSDTVDSNDGFIDHMSQSDDDQADITFDDEPNTAFVYCQQQQSNPEIGPLPWCENGTEILDSEDDDVDEMSTEDLMADASGYLRLVELICMFLLSWQCSFRIPDAAIISLLKFLKMVFSTFVKNIPPNEFHEISKVFPDTLQKAQELCNINRDNFKLYITCQRCHCIYPSDESTSTLKCSFVAFPRHPQKCMRSRCDCGLKKEVKTASGKKLSRPIKVYCYKSVLESISEMVQKPGMLDLLNHWKSRCIPNGVLADIYDGVTWKSFLNINGETFIQCHYSIGLLISIDWFQPFKHVQYSIGAIYLVVLNLPRSLRYLKENMILAGIIPGPNEPSLHVNSFLEPLVADLQKLWKGVEIETSEGNNTFFAAVICNSCDIPACRKLGGFVGHNAKMGCSRCLKSFSTESRKFGDKADYSGFNCALWPRRDAKCHHDKGMDWKHARTLADRNKIEHDFGIRYTELIRLTYFDTPRFTVVDPLHNILLGTPKRMVSIWKDKGHLCTAQFEAIQLYCNKFVVPSDIGRIPHKISSGFASFTADQWKNWTLIYSLVTLKNILPIVEYNCWKLYVKACSLVCSKAITVDAINECHSLLIAFCTKFEQLYGPELCTINLHLHCHIKECLLDYGPGCSFWLFACERMNGLLGSVPTNHHSIEIQLMRKLSSIQQATYALSMSDDSAIKNILDSFQSTKGSLKYERLPDLPILQLSLDNLETVNQHCKLLHPIKEAILCSAELESVDSTLKAIFGTLHVRTLMLHKVSQAIVFCNTLYGSSNSIHHSSSMIYVKSASGSSIPAFVKNYITVSAMFQTDNSTKLIDVTMASVNWLLPHQHKEWFGSPIEVWRVFNPCNHSDAYVPVTDLLCRCAYVTERITFGIVEDIVTIVVPINNFSGL